MEDACKLVCLLQLDLRHYLSNLEKYLNLGAFNAEDAKQDAEFDDETAEQRPAFDKRQPRKAFLASFVRSR